MKKVEREEVLSSYSSVCKKMQELIDCTDMEDNELRKRTKNYFDWTNEKTEIIINEKSFDCHDPVFQSIKRGSVVWIEFGFNIGVEFGGKHPAIVLRNAGSSLYVVPLSSQKPREIKPYHIRIDKVYGFKNLIRWANVLKLQNVSLQRVDVLASIGNVKGEYLDKINNALKSTYIF